MPLGVRYSIVSSSNRTRPLEIKKTFGINVDLVGYHRVIFDIGGKIPGDRRDAC
nr:type II toxin-antitoxin system HigB family toxin [Rhizobium sp. SEMIA 4085]